MELDFQSLFIVTLHLHGFVNTANRECLTDCFFIPAFNNQKYLMQTSSFSLTGLKIILSLILQKRFTNWSKTLSSPLCLNQNEERMKNQDENPILGQLPVGPYVNQTCLI